MSPRSVLRRGVVSVRRRRVADEEFSDLGKSLFKTGSEIRCQHVLVRQLLGGHRQVSGEFVAVLGRECDVAAGERVAVFEQRRLRVRLADGREAVTVNVDQRRLQQVCQAVSKAGGPVRVEVRVSGAGGTHERIEYVRTRPPES